MRYALAAFFLFLLVPVGTTVWAQPTLNDVGFSAERPAIRVAATPSFQYYDDEGQSLTQWSLPLRAGVPLSRSVHLRLAATVASADISGGGENVVTSSAERVTGLTDVQTELSYVREVGAGSVIFNVGVNIPTGKDELTLAEFATVTLLSQNIYDFHAPGFGQGLGVRTGASWALPVGERVVVGLGGSFQVQGGYTPVQGMTEEYTPGNEFLVTGGLDVQLTSRSALSGDVAVTVYGTDTLGDLDQFEAGNQVAGSLQYLREWGFNRLQIRARYASREKSSVAAVGSIAAPVQDVRLQVLPSQGSVHAGYGARLTEGMRLQLTAAGRWYEETALLDATTVGRIGVEPQFALTEDLVFAPRAVVSAGGYTGVEGGMRIVATY